MTTPARGHEGRSWTKGQSGGRPTRQGLSCGAAGFESRYLLTQGHMRQPHHHCIPLPHLGGSEISRSHRHGLYRDGRRGWRASHCRVPSTGPSASLEGRGGVPPGRDIISHPSLRARKGSNEWGVTLWLFTLVRLPTRLLPHP